jgi:HTH-type transcriptional regulator/antitoxin HigA
MSTIVEINPKHYAKLLARTLPAVIESEQEYERLFREFDSLWKRQHELPPEEDKLLSLLVLLIEDYEERHHSLDASTPHSRLRHLMEARGLAQKDIWRLLGSRGVASEVINGKRAISKSQAKRLAEFFHVTPDLFL